MRNRRLITFLLVFLPLVVGVLASFATPLIWTPDPVPILQFRIDVGMMTFIAGLFITVLLLAFWLGGAANERRANQLIEESLRETEQGRQRFLRRLDHEIKNPLTGLRAALVNLQETGDSAERHRASEHAHRAVERLTRLLTDLRKLSDLEERSIERLSVDVPELLEDVVEAARALPAYEGRNINLFISKVPSPFPGVTGDRDLLVLAVYNLVENALKFTSASDSLEVRALEDGKTIVIEVADSGTGISSEDQSKIFEELYRGSNARSTEGSGLGLALVNRIIALHGGVVSVRSNQSEPRGTVFTVRLPVRR